MNINDIYKILDQINKNKLLKTKKIKNKSGRKKIGYPIF